MKKEKEAIYIGANEEQKLAYRAVKPDGTTGVAYIKNGVEHFTPVDDVIRQIVSGPRKRVG